MFLFVAFFAESPQADEVSFLQSQAVLLHCQVVLERYLRQQYAQRCRAMQTNTIHIRAMEEQMAALVGRSESVNFLPFRFL